MRFLLVEDEKKVADFVARGLRAERYAVDIAHDGITGWEMVSGTSYVFIILDLMLPGLNGTELLTRFRRQGGTAPVLVLTARDATNEKVANFEAGADDYLTKPFAFAELLVRVKALLRRPPASHDPVLRVGDLEIDRLTQQVRRAGKRIELTAKEYALLEYLAANAGRVLSRTMIVEHVWDESEVTIPAEFRPFMEVELHAKVSGVQAAGESLRDLENNVIRDVRVAWLNSQNAFDRLRITQQLLDNARQSFALARARYKNGISSMVELNQAELNEISAEIAHANTQYEYLLQRSNLSYQTGTLQ